MGTCISMGSESAMPSITTTQERPHTIESCKDCNRFYMREKARRYAIEVREQLFRKLGNKCARCGFADIRALQLDHIYGDSGEAKRTHRSTRYYRQVLRDVAVNYQILCANCNWIKRYENNEVPRLTGPAHGIAVNS